MYEHSYPKHVARCSRWTIKGIFSPEASQSSRSSDVAVNAAAAVYIIPDFDIFASRPIQSSNLETRYKPIADQRALGFVIHANNETYVDICSELYVRGKLVNSCDGKKYGGPDFSWLTKNILHSLFSKYAVTLNGESVASASGHYNYHGYLESLLTYGR